LSPPIHRLFVKSRKRFGPGAKAYRKLARLAASVTAKKRHPLPGLLLAQYARQRFAADAPPEILRSAAKPGLSAARGASPIIPVHPMLRKPHI